uniref:Uncharacterized protein n=1 Tax=Magallana gigas TaxID=29159 RepID=A0A8W8LN38_MAGGI
MPRGKPARKRPAASASAERQPAQSTKRRHTGRSTADPFPAVEDNINAVSNSESATNEATDAVCTSSLDSASVNGPGSSIQGSTAGIFQVTDPHHRTEARFLLQDQLNHTEPDSLMYPELQGLGKQKSQTFNENSYGSQRLIEIEEEKLSVKKQRL